MPEDPSKMKKEPNPMRDYLKYSGVAFQMLGVIGLSIWGGMKLDEKFNNGKPLFLLILTFLGIFGSLYGLYRSMPKS